MVLFANSLQHDKATQWRAGYYFSGWGGAVGYQSIIQPYNVMLGERRPKVRGERHRSEGVLGVRGMLPRKFFKFRVSEMPFPGLWGKI